MIVSQRLHTLAGQVVCAVGFGLEFGGFIPTNTIVIKNMNQNFGTSLSLYFCISGIASILGPLLVGRIMNFEIS